LVGKSNATPAISRPGSTLRSFIVVKPFGSIV
jgi:hypothetical protein